MPDKIVYPWGYARPDTAVLLAEAGVPPQPGMFLFCMAGEARNWEAHPASGRQAQMFGHQVAAYSLQWLTQIQPHPITVCCEPDTPDSPLRYFAGRLHHYYKTEHTSIRSYDIKGPRIKCEDPADALGHYYCWAITNKLAHLREFGLKQVS